MCETARFAQKCPLFCGFMVHGFVVAKFRFWSKIQLRGDFFGLTHFVSEFCFFLSFGKFGLTRTNSSQWEQFSTSAILYSKVLLFLLKIRLRVTISLTQRFVVNPVLLK